MKLKSYFSATVEAAMEMARKELGEEALLVNAKPTSGAARSLGAFEVVFGVTAPERSGRLLKRLANEPTVDSTHDSRPESASEAGRISGMIEFPPPIPLDRIVKDLPPVDRPLLERQRESDRDASQRLLENIARLEAIVEQSKTYQQAAVAAGTSSPSI